MDVIVQTISDTDTCSDNQPLEMNSHANCADAFGKFIAEGLKSIPDQHKRDKLMQDIFKLYFSEK